MYDIYDQKTIYERLRRYIFMMNFSLNCHGRLLDLSTPAVMGIVNLTPDSFFDGGKNNNDQLLLQHVEFLLSNGADILDIGGQSTRPGAEIISESEEWNRIEKAIPIILKEFPDSIISVDTFYSTIAEKSADQGASIINDISGGTHDNKMFDTIAKLQLPYVLMHIPGTTQSMHAVNENVNIVLEVWNYLDKKIAELRSMGIFQIIIDPGFGFGKTIEQNYSLLKNMHVFNNFNAPILAGMSRKSMVNKVLKVDAKNSLNGTSVLNTIALLNKASILRVHDVIEAKQVITLVEQYRKVE